MRRQLTRLLFVFFVAVGSACAEDEDSAKAFARMIGLVEVDEFAAAVETIRRTGDLPPSWITKNDARRLGWEPGRDLCEVAQDVSIGGDRFGNREGRLPDAPGRRWYEADLDSDCGHRGARRLVFSSDGLIFATLDHYETFIEVPR